MTEERIQDTLEESFAFAELILAEKVSNSYFLNINADQYAFFECLENFDMKKRIYELELQGFLDIA